MRPPSVASGHTGQTFTSRKSDGSARLTPHCPHVLWQPRGQPEAALMEIPEGCTEVCRFVDLPENPARDYIVKRDDASGQYLLTSASMDVSMWAPFLQMVMPNPPPVLAASLRKPRPVSCLSVPQMDGRSLRLRKFVLQLSYCTAYE